MNVSLTPKLEEMIRTKVDSGMYNNASEVVREALRIMERKEREDKLRAAIAFGEADIAAGRVVEWTPDSMERLIQEAKEMNQHGLPIRDEIKP